MAKRIAKYFTETLLNKVDVISVLSQKITLKKSGKNYQACCPFHNEKTPSFSVSPEKGVYYCFGCGAKGNAISFLMSFEHLSFVESVERLADIAGISVEYDSNFDQKKVEKRKSLYELLDKASKMYEQQLVSISGEKARKYLLNRQVDQAHVNFFRLGFAKKNSQLIKAFEGDYNYDDLEKVALSKKGDKNYYDVFRDRLMFPIRDPRGRVVAFGARALNDEVKPKYLNSPESEVFAKRFVLYGLYELLQSKINIESLIFVEGYMDVIALYQAGVSGAVATLGTALTQEHVALARRYSKKFYVCFDGDNAGLRAAERAIETILPTMELGMEVRFVFLPKGEDPDSLTKQKGKSAFEKLLAQGKVLSEVVFDNLVRERDLTVVEGRGEVADRAKKLFNKLPESEYRSMLYQNLVEKLNIDFLNLSTIATKDLKSNVRKVKQIIPRANQYDKFGSAARLIRLLLDYPDFAFYAKYTDLLANRTSDEQLLMLLIKFFQLHSESSNKEKALLIFPKHYQIRLNEILDNQSIEKIDSQIEALRSRRKVEFVAGFEKLINKLHREIIFKSP